MNAQLTNIPVHSVYPRDEMLPVNHVVDTSDDTRNSLTMHWIPIYLKFAICITMAIILVILKLYYDNELTQLQLVTFVTLSVVFLVCTTFMSLWRIRKSRLMFAQLAAAQNDFLEANVEPVTIVTRSLSSDGMGDPPPYSIAIQFPEKHSKIKADSSPPPAYDKIAII